MSHLKWNRQLTILVVLWFSLLHAGYDRSETPYDDAKKCWIDAVSILNKESRVADAFCRPAETNREQATPKKEPEV